MNVPVVRRILSAAAAAALGLSLTACSALSSDSSGSKASGGAEGALSVAVSFYPIQYLTEAIGGDHVNVTSVTPAGQEPHDYDIPLETVNSLNNASLIAYVAGFQPSLDKAVTQVSGPTVVDLADKVNLKHHEGVEEEHSDDDEAGSAEKEQAAEDPDGSHDATHDHDHDADSLDPHFWLDPVRMTSAATAIEEALAAADPDHADDYKANLDSLTSTLDGLDSSYKGGLA